jgi:hypothetical protein
LAIKGVYILAHTETSVKENLVSEGQKLDWRTGTANYKMMGLDVGRIPQVGDWGAEVAGQRDGGGVFYTFLGAYGNNGRAVG